MRCQFPADLLGELEDFIAFELYRARCPAVITVTLGDVKAPTHGSTLKRPDHYLHTGQDALAQMELIVMDVVNSWRRQREWFTWKSVKLVPIGYDISAIRYRLDVARESRT